MDSTCRAKRWPDAAAVAVFAALTLATFWQAFIRPTEMIREDAAWYYQPYYTFAADEVRAGRLPLWNPFTQLGIPFHAGLQASLFYPLRWPAFFMSYVHAYIYLLWIHYFLTAVAAYLFMRLALRVGPAAGCLGAMSIAFGGFALGHMTHFTYFTAYPWFLGALLCVWLSVQRADRRWTPAAATCVGMMALIGAVHLLLILAILFAAYVLYHTVQAIVSRARGAGDGWSVMRPALVVAAAVTMGGLLGAVQIMPARELIKGSVREELDWEAANSACAHPWRNTVQLVAPFWMGNWRLGYWGEYNAHDMAHYTGAIVLVAAAVGVVSLGRDRHLWFLVLLAAIGFFLGAGKYLPVYRYLYDWLPPFRQLRNPTRIFWLTDIAIACLGAIGIDRVLRRAGAQAMPRGATVTATIAGVLFAAVLGWSLLKLDRYARHPDQLVDWVNRNPNIVDDIWKPTHVQAAREQPAAVVRQFDKAAWTNIAAAVAGVILLQIAVRRRRAPGVPAAVVLVAIMAADLFAMSLGTIQYGHEDYLVTRTPVHARWLQENLGQQRYSVLWMPRLLRPEDQMFRNTPMLYRLRSTEGNAGGILEVPARQKFNLSAMTHPAFRSMAGVKYMLVEPAVARFASPGTTLRLVWQDAQFLVFENPTCLPLAYFVRNVLKASDTEEAYRMIKARWRDSAVVYDTPPQETAASTAKNAQVLGIHEVPGRWMIEVSCDAPAQLVISEGYDAGWRCTISGRSVPVYRTNDQLMSVAVPAGPHRVVLEYSPRAFRHGLLLTLLGVAGTIALARFRARSASSARFSGNGPSAGPA